MKRPVLPPAKVHTWHGVTQLPFIDLWSVWHVPSPSYVIFWKTFHLKDTEAEVAWLAGIGERNVSFICWFTAHISHISVIARDGTLERSLCLPSVCEQECGIRNQICDSDSACSCYALIMPSSWAPTHHALSTTERVTKQESENGTLGSGLYITAATLEPKAMYVSFARQHPLRPVRILSGGTWGTQTTLSRMEYLCRRDSCGTLAHSALCCSQISCCMGDTGLQESPD